MPGPLAFVHARVGAVAATLDLRHEDRSRTEEPEPPLQESDSLPASVARFSAHEDQASAPVERSGLVELESAPGLAPELQEELEELAGPGEVHAAERLDGVSMAGVEEHLLPLKTGDLRSRGDEVGDGRSARA